VQVPGLDTAVHHVRAATKFAPERPALWLGLRTAAATAIPIAIASFIDPIAAAWAPLAGFIVALVDKGGAYRSRATVMGSVAIGGLLAVLVGSLIAGHGIVTAIVVAACLAMCAFAQAFGPAMVSAGNTIAIQLLVAASLPCTPQEALERGIGFAWGAGFALVLALIVWPVRVYKPGRRAVGEAYGAIARHARALAAEVRGAGDWRTQAAARHRSIREQIEVARVVLAATRRGRRGETGRGERLLAMVQLADQMFGVLTGVEETIEAGAASEARELAVNGLAVLADGLAELATNVLIERPPAATTPEWTASLPAAGAEVAQTLGAHAIALLVRAHQDRLTAARVLATLADDSEPLNAVLPDADPQPALRERLSDAFDIHGAIARHALRVAVAVSIAMAIARGLDLSHRYWVTLTTFLLLQPQGAATRVRALQRVVGTFVGALIAAVLPSLITDPRHMVAVAVVLAGISASVVRINYALFATFLTPTFVLLAEVHAHDPHLIGTRLANTLLGAGIAIAASLAWHIRPVRQFDEQIAEAYDAAIAYLDAVVTAVTNNIPQPSPAIQRARRGFGVTINRCEVAIEQILAERVASPATEPRMTQIAFLRRLASAITAFGSTRGVAAYGPHHVEIAAFAASITGTLRELAAAARGTGALGARPRIDRVAADPLLAARLARIDLVVVALVEAALRAARTT
jgi:uncharacterized membrane protein YccC